MTSGGPTDEADQSFRIHGGECVVSADGTVRIDRSLLRHHHPLAWLFGIASAVTAAYSLATGWRYTAGTGELVDWPFFVLSTGLVLGLPLWRRLVDRYEGYTNANTIRLSAIETVTVTSTEIRWYFKTRRTVPVCVVRYRTDGETRKRRFKLPLRSGRKEVQAAVDAFEEHDTRVERDLTDDDIPASPAA